MKELLKANIKKSIKIIAEDNPKIPAELIQVVEEEPRSPELTNLVEEMMKVAAQPIPWFYRDSAKELQSPQESFFGFYSLRNIIRGILLSLRFIQAGDLLHKNDFLAASVFSYYTSSFHLLHAFLASYGRVVVDQVHGGPIKIINRRNSAGGSFSSLNPTPEVIVAILVRNNIWKFEPRPRSHTRRWKELEHIFVELNYDIPEFLHSFFRYILSYGNLSSSKPEAESFIQDGLKRLADVRHESIYSGYGFDDYVHDGLINRDLDTSYGIDLKSKAYRNLALGFLVHAVRDVIGLMDKIPAEHWANVRMLMAGSVYTPPFELVELKLEDARELNEQVEIIFTWLMDRSIKHDRT